MKKLIVLISNLMIATSAFIVPNTPVTTSVVADGKCSGGTVVVPPNTVDVQLQAGVPYLLHAGKASDWDIVAAVQFMPKKGANRWMENFRGLQNVGYILRIQTPTRVCAPFGAAGASRIDAHLEGAHVSILLRQSWYRNVRPVSSRPCYPNNGCDFVIVTSVSTKSKIQERVLQNPDGNITCP